MLKLTIYSLNFLIVLHLGFVFVFSQFGAVKIVFHGVVNKNLFDEIHCSVVIRENFYIPGPYVGMYIYVLCMNVIIVKLKQCRFNKMYWSKFNF